MDLFRADEFSAYVKKLMDDHHVPGLSIAILQDEEIDSAGFGKASLDPPQDCTADTLFDIASACKSLTAGSAALLVDDNDKHPLVQYETPMSSLLPGDFVMPGEDHGDVSLEDILSHRTGMAPHDYSYLGPKAAQPDDARSITRNLRNLTVTTPNRMEYNYCNMMYTVAAYLVERISGLTFAEFLESRIFRPLAMHSTNLQPDRARAKGLGDRIATGHFWDKEAEKYHPIPCSDSPEAQGAGRVITSANDYIKWVKAMMRQEGPITESVYEGLVKKRISHDPPVDSNRDSKLANSSQTYHSAGWQIREYGGNTMVSHDGSDDGFRSIHFLVPEVKFGGVIIANSDGASDVLTTIMYKLVDWVGHAQKFGGLPDVTTALESEPGPGFERDDNYDASSSVVENELRTELCPELKEPMPQTMPLSAYTGQYWNAGYRGIKVEERDDALFIDGTDRSMGFTLTFKHVCEQTKYIAHLNELPEFYEVPIKAEFKFKGDQAVEMGLHLDEVLEEYIWFTRMEG